MVKSGPSALKKFKMAVKSNSSTASKSNSTMSKRSLNQKRLLTENPFEKKFNNVKFDILNKKGASKADALRNPARPGRKKAVEFGRKRDALRMELENRKRVGLMVDKRIGEYDASMSAEDKMLLRFMKEKSEASAAHSARNVNFNLNDDDDQGDNGLTHMGQSLSAIDDFTASGLQAVNVWDDEDPDAGKGGQIDADVVKFTHFGGFEADERDKANPMHKKSRNEIMKEIIQKSKMHKRERQMQKEQDLDLVEQVDADLDEIRNLLAPMSSADAIPATHNKMTVSSDRLRMIQGLDPLSSSEQPQQPPLPKIEEYDRVFRELARDGRAAPTDRTKSEQEVAAEAADKLRAAETRRGRRMQGLYSDSEEDEGGERIKKRKNKTRGSGGGEDAVADDLGDEVWGAQVAAVRGREEVMPLTYDKEGRLVNKEIFMKPKEDSDDDDDGENGDSASDEESEEEESDDASSQTNDEEPATKIDSLEPEFDSSVSSSGDDDNDADNDVEQENSDSSEDESDKDSDQAALEEMYEGNSSPSETEEEEQENKPKKRKRADKENIMLQASKELPYTFDAPTCFAEFKELVKDRSLSEELVIVKRLLILYNVKLDGRNRLHMENFSCILMERVVELGNDKSDQEGGEKLVKYREQAVQLGRLYPNAFAKWCKSEIQILRDSFNKKIGAISKKTAFPGPGHITLFSDFARIFSCSDLQHQVMNPVMLLLCQYLCQAPITGPKDGLIGIVICHIIYSYTCESKRYVPEVVSFLHLMLVQCLKGSKGIVAPRYLSTVRKCATGVLPVVDFAAEYDEFNLNELYKSGNDESTSSMKMVLLHESIALLVKFCKLWNDTSCIMEVFGETMDIIKLIPSTKTNPKLLTQIAEASRMIGPLLESARLKRRPLQLQKRKAVAIKTFVPKFQTSYSIDKRYDPDHARAQEGKLKAEYKKEFKGAVRELRKDAAFLVRDKLEKIKESDAKYKKKMDKIVGQLAEQEGAMRGFEKAAKKKNGKRR